MEDDLAAENALCNAHFQAARKKQEAGDLDGAASMYGMALANGWAIDYALTDLGVIAMKRGLAGRAQRLLEAALAVNPHHVLAMTNLGVLCRLLGRNAEAVQWSDRALELAPDDTSALNCRGSGLFALLDYAGAADAFNRVLQLDPDHAQASGNMAAALVSLGRYHEAMPHFRKAFELAPKDANPNFTYGKLLLKFGHFGEGWLRYEARWAATMNGMQKHTAIPSLIGQVDTVGKRVFVHQDIAGKTVLVHQEQGFGDCIQFCRLLKPLSERGCCVVFEVDEALHPVMAPLASYARLIAKGDAIGDVDFQIPLMSLPLYLGTDIGTIPTADDCFVVPGSHKERWRAKLGDRVLPRIGVAWSGRAEYWMDSQRSMPLSDLVEIDKRFEVVSIQKEVRERDAEELSRRGYKHFGSELRTFADTAALIDGLDLIISVDTGVAHLAASLGKTVWLMLPTNSDWRWLIERQDSPWYPTMRIFRQSAQGDWPALMAEVRGALDAFVADGLR